MKSFGVPLCGMGSGRAVNLDFAGRSGADLGQRKSPERDLSPGPCLWQERSVSIANCMVSQKREGRVWENRRFLPHMERSGSPRRSGRQKKKAPFVPFSFVYLE